MEILYEIGIESFPRKYEDKTEEAIEIGDMLKKCIEWDVTKSLEVVRIVRRWCWDKLNIGVYTDIKPIWRQGYYDSTVILACRMIDAGFDSRQIYRIIDEGLLMGQQDQYSTLQFICLKLKEKETDQNERLQISDEIFNKTEDVQTNIKILDKPPSYLEWKQIKYKKEPILIKNCVNDWPAMEKWNFQYFYHLMKNRTVPIEIGEKYTDTDWGQQLQRFGDFLEKVLKGEEKNYLAQHPLLEQIPELEEDIIVPDYCFIDNDIDDAEINAWIGPKGTISSLHTDNKENLFVQIKGYKMFKLISPKFNDKIKPIDDVMFNSSRLDVENKIEDVEVETVLVGPGDMLYIPKLHWHYVRHRDFNFYMKLDKMVVKDTLKYFYMKKLRFLQKRQTIRLMKTSIGFSTMAGCTMWFIWNIREGLEEVKTRRSGSDSIVAASILGRVSGMGENQLSEGKSLQQMVADVEARAAVPYENIRTPRPWEMETEESKKKYLKRAYKELEDKIDERAQNRKSEEDRIAQEIALIRAKNAQKS